jgi:hypothetical protein
MLCAEAIDGLVVVLHEQDDVSQLPPVDCGYCCMLLHCCKPFSAAGHGTSMLCGSGDDVGDADGSPFMHAVLFL